MFLASLLLAAAVTPPAVLGRITGIAVPATIQAGETFRAIIITSGSSQSVDDVAISFGLGVGDVPRYALGTLLSSRFVGPDDSNVAYNLSHYVTVPAGTPKGRALLTSALYSLTGAADSPTLSAANVTVAIGDASSDGAKWVTAMHTSI